MRPFSVVILAAGGSHRLGRPKQLVEYRGEPLVVRAVRTAILSGAAEVIVVLGAHHEAVRARLDQAFGRNTVDLSLSTLEVGAKLQYVLNEQWQEGMGTSIGVGAAAFDPEFAEAMVLMTCDQPLVTSALLLDLVASLSDAKPISACSYAGISGVPCAFDWRLVPDLMELGGDRGARDLIRDPSRSVSLVDFEGGAFDIDTREDLHGYSDHLDAEGGQERG